MRVIQIPTLFDNYTYLIVCEKTGMAAIVDSPDAEKTISVIKKEGVNPVAIFSTHHHLDHVGGNEALLKFKKMKIYGGKNDALRIPGLTHPVGEGDEIKLGSLTLKILDIPGHTSGHIAYVGDGVVFCGDTLFAGGCGRLFEGTPSQMSASLCKLKKLSNSTLVYCGHEYTQKNLEFAGTLEPDNISLKEKLKEVVLKRKRGEPTVPTTMREEKSYNPFLRTDSEELVQNLKRKAPPGFKEDPVSLFFEVRKLKDNYYRG